MEQDTRQLLDGVEPALRDYQLLFESLLESVLMKEQGTVDPAHASRQWIPARYFRSWRRYSNREALQIFIRLSRKLREADIPALYAEAYFSLLQYRTDPASAARLGIDTEFLATRNAPIRFVFRGALTFLLLYVVVWAAVEKFRPFADAVATRPDFIAVGISGVVGAIVSLAMRRDEFAEAKGKGPLYFTFTGFLLPMIGTIFGTVIYSLLLSQMITLSLGSFQPSSNPSQFSVPYLSGCVAVGFLCGFSERFALALLNRIPEK